VAAAISGFGAKRRGEVLATHAGMSEQSEEPVAATTHRPSVLIVDDQPAIRAVLTSILVGHGGFHVADAEDGIAALARMDDGYTRGADAVRHAAALDLVVLDILMPKLSGLDVLTAMRWSYAAPPRTMVISALGDEEHVAEALRLGAIDYLPKPIDAGMFLHRVETLCSTTAPTPFHWAPLAKLPTIQLGDVSAQAKAISESGIIVQTTADERPAIDEVIELASPVFDECGITRRMRGRVVRVTKLRGRRTMELTFVGLHERDLCGIRRFSVRR
jgi:DNA-binding response OmpR family regulator